MTVELERIREQRLKLWSEAASRWEAQRHRREGVLGKLRGRQGADAPERVMNYIRREAERPRSSPGLRALVRQADTLGGAEERVRFLERRIGPSLDWKPEPSGATARAAGGPVGRLCSSAQAQDEVGFATGFLVSPSLLLTNHHVFMEPGDAEGTFVQFGYEIVDGAVRPGTFFRLDPGHFFSSNGDLDFALVGVEQRSLDGSRNLGELSPLRLIPEPGKILIGHAISIIQHPNGGTKRYAEHENKLLDVLEDFLQYTTDTSPGSSGAPCFNSAWEVVALHHSGIPRTQGGRILRADGTLWDRSMGEHEIDWIANEGVRVSRLVAELRKTEWEGDRRARIEELLARSSTPLADPEPLAPLAEETPTALAPAALARGPRQGSERQATTSIHVHGSATFYVACDLQSAAEHAPTAGASGTTALKDAEKKLRFDPDYAGRKGYDPDFLGVNVPLPGVAPSRRNEMVKALGNRILVLHYHHYSLAMNKNRRLQMWSAANVDYSPAARKHAAQREAFGDDTWILDPRLPAYLQLQDHEFYAPATAIDRGHIVRREDSCFGRTFRETEYANSDTFHWTNCTPQHERFNQSRQGGLWGRLEGAIKARARGDAQRLSLFAGPVLDASDPDAYGIQYPVRYWKVVAALEDGVLSAYGFVLDQSAVVEQYGLEELDFVKFKVSQRSLSRIQTLSGVVLPPVLQAADVMQGHESLELHGVEEVRYRARS